MTRREPDEIDEVDRDRASARYVRVTPMKARRVVDLIRGMQAPRRWRS